MRGNPQTAELSSIEVSTDDPGRKKWDDARELSRQMRRYSDVMGGISLPAQAWQNLALPSSVLQNLALPSDVLRNFAFSSDILKNVALPSDYLKNVGLLSEYFNAVKYPVHMQEPSEPSEAPDGETFAEADAELVEKEENDGQDEED
jgi:hypothetical protein